MISPAESRVLDINAEALGVATITLMENAGKCIADHLFNNFEQSNVLIVCGTGNNGGDGAVAARYLKEKGWNVTLALVKSREDIKSQLFLQNLEKLPEGVLVVENAGPEVIAGFPMILDAMLGTGLKDQPREPYGGWISAINAADAKVVSIDVPSGLGTGLAIKPHVTISFHDSKDGMTPENSGENVVADIGIPKEASEFVGPGEFVFYPLPEESSHKGQNGRLLIVGGGPYTGAPALSAMAALRTGVDLVWLAVPESCWQVVASYSPNFIVKSLAGDCLVTEHLPVIRELIKEVDAVLIGPGLGRDERTVKAVRQLLSEIEKPIVVDADGLYALSEGQRTILNAPAVLTPHRKEFERLVGEAAATDENTVAELANKLGTTLVLKGPEDVISDGQNIKKNMTGNAAMSIGGTGDVLAGIIGALLAKGVAPYNAGRMGTYLSGRAGDHAFEELGYSLTATDVIANIPEALRLSLGHLK